MDPKDLALLLADTLDEKQASDIVILDVEDLVGYTSFFVLCSGRSERQVQALAEHARRHPPPQPQHALDALAAPVLPPPRGQ